MKLSDFIDNAGIYNAKVITTEDDAANGAESSNYLDLDAQRPQGLMQGLGVVYPYGIG